MARIMDPEAWKTPLNEEHAFAVRRIRSLQKTEKMLRAFRTKELMPKLVEELNNGR